MKLASLTDKQFERVCLDLADKMQMDRWEYAGIPFGPDIDCYMQKCKLCDETMPVELEATARDEVEVYCDKCIPDDTSDGTVWKWMKGRMFIKPLTENAQSHRNFNAPNDFSTEA